MALFYFWTGSGGIQCSPVGSGRVTWGRMIPCFTPYGAFTFSNTLEFCYMTNTYLGNDFLILLFLKTIECHLFLFCFYLDEEMRDDPSGATAVCVLIKNNKIYCVRIFVYFMVELYLGLGYV